MGIQKYVLTNINIYLGPTLSLDHLTFIEVKVVASSSYVDAVYIIPSTIKQFINLGSYTTF